MVVVHLTDFSFLHSKDISDIIKVNQKALKCRIFPSLTLLISLIKDPKHSHKMLAMFVGLYLT